MAGEPKGPDLSRELEIAERAARQAGEIIAGYLGSGIDVDEKPGDEGPVTRADREANELIVATLGREFPGDGVLSEELPDDGEWRRADRVWMIDPLDGTADFIRGWPGFAVMIGLLWGDRPLLGVIYQPVTGRLLRAAPGAPPERLERDGSRLALRVSEVEDLASLRMVSSASHRTGSVETVRRELGIRDETSVGSVGLKLGLIAAGERDLYVNPASKSSLWDCAAPQAILDAAGGRLTDLAGAPLRYRDADVKNRRGLVASNGRAHDAVLTRLLALFHGNAPDL